MKNLKPLLITLTFFGLFYFANAQTEKENEEVEKENIQLKKGAILLGGNSKLNFASLKSKVASKETYKKTNIEFSPKIGFFITDNSVLGFELPFTYTSEKRDSYDNKYTSFAFTPFIRRYFGRNNIKPYLEGQVGFGHVKSEYSFLSTNKSSGNLFLYGIEGGIGIFLNEKVSLDIAAGYASSSIKFKDADSKQITNGIGLGVGIVIIL